MKTQKGNVAVISLIVIVAVVGVGIIGWMFAKKLQAPVELVAQTQSVVQPAVIESQSVAQPMPMDETADWKTYTNAERGYTFKYPAKWEESDLGPMVEGISVTSPRKPNKSVDDGYLPVGRYFDVEYDDTSVKYVGGNEVSLEAWVHYDLDSVVSRSVAGTIGYEGIFSNESIDFAERHIVIEHNGHLFTIGMSVNLDDAREQEIILSTFKFTK